jgi:hypothetical protein
VQNTGNKYQCKPYPYTGWCNGAAWAYAPGTGTAWQDAWTLVSSCVAARQSGIDNNVQIILSPNPASNSISIDFSNAGITESDIIIENLYGEQLLQRNGVRSGDLLSIETLSPGTYVLHLIQGNNNIVLKFVKQ